MRPAATVPLEGEAGMDMRRGLVMLAMGALLVAGCTSTPAPAARATPPRVVPAPAPQPARPPAVLAPGATPDEERRLARLTGENIESAEQALRRIDHQRLSAEQRDTALTIRSFIAKAREALGANDLARASTLADKARVLADELGRSAR
jgi:hypothetical protein